MSTELTQKLLQDAWDRIKNPTCWTQNTSAREINGAACASDSPDAVRWCSTGSVAASTYGYKDRAGNESIENIDDYVMSKLDKAVLSIFGEQAKQNTMCPIIYVNDHLGHEQVMECFKKAIELCQEEISTPQSK